MRAQSTFAQPAVGGLLSESIYATAERLPRRRMQPRRQDVVNVVIGVQRKSHLPKIVLTGDAAAGLTCGLRLLAPARLEP